MTGIKQRRAEGQRQPHTATSGAACSGQNRAKGELRLAFCIGLALALFVPGCGRDNAPQNVVVLKGSFKRTDAKVFSLNTTNYFTIAYNPSLFCITSFDGHTNLLTQEFYDGVDFASWRRATHLTTNSSDAAYIWNTHTMIHEWPLSYNESLLTSVLAVACPDMKRNILGYYENYYTNFIDCIQLVSKRKLAEAASNGFRIVDGIQSKDLKTPDGLFVSRDYFAYFMSKDGKVITNIFCNISFSNYYKLNGNSIPCSIRIHDANLGDPINLNYVIELGIPLMDEIRKDSIYPDLSSMTSVFDERIGSRHYYIRNGGWPTQQTRIHKDAAAKRAVILALLVTLIAFPIVGVSILKLKLSSKTKYNKQKQ